MKHLVTASIKGAALIFARIERDTRAIPHIQFPKSHHPGSDLPEEFEPGAPPVEPDQGPVPTLIPNDPEYDRIMYPAANRVWQAQHTSRQAETAKCL